MYAPNLVPRDVHHLWLTTNDSTKRHNDHKSQKEQAQSQALQMRFAPPLSAYSANYPGATNIRSDRNRQIVAADIQTRLDYLSSVKTLGYNYLKPIGINRTIQQMIDEEELLAQDEADDNGEAAPTAENLLNEPNATANNNISENTSNTHLTILADGSFNITGEPPILDQELDLDAGIQDEDSNSDYDYDLENSRYTNDVEDNLIDEDEGFMAADEEYQEDHSISADSNPMNNYSGNAPVTSTTFPTTASGNTNNLLANTSIQSSSSMRNFRSFSSPINLRRENTSAATAPGETSFNGSELDMMIDEND